MLRQPAASWRLRNARNGLVVAGRIEPAFDSPRRRKGLLGRRVFPLDSALILAPCSSIHTLFMRFPIELAFVSRECAVLRVLHAIGPWRLGRAFGAFAAVELPSA